MDLSRKDVRKNYFNCCSRSLSSNWNPNHKNKVTRFWFETKLLSNMSEHKNWWTSQSSLSEFAALLLCQFDCKSKTVYLPYCKYKNFYKTFDKIISIKKDKVLVSFLWRHPDNKLCLKNWETASFNDLFFNHMHCNRFSFLSLKMSEKSKKPPKLHLNLI